MENYIELTKDQLLIELDKKEKELVEAQKQVVKSEHKAVILQDKLQLTAAFPGLAERRAEMQYHLDLADKFAKSKAFNPSYTPEQIYVLMKAGREMGMSEVQSLQALYIVNGQIDFYGDKMVARLTQAGYTVEYLNEITEPGKEEVTVKVTSKDGTFSATEKATSKDQIILQSKAAKFALKNKLRFHAVRMVASFHLPHLFQSVSDMFTSEFTEYQDVSADIQQENKSAIPANSKEISFDPPESASEKEANKPSDRLPNWSS